MNCSEPKVIFTKYEMDDYVRSAIESKIDLSTVVRSHMKTYDGNQWEMHYLMLSYASYALAKNKNRNAGPDDSSLYNKCMWFLELLNAGMRQRGVPFKEMIDWMYAVDKERPHFGAPVDNLTAQSMYRLKFEVLAFPNRLKGESKS